MSKKRPFGLQFIEVPPQHLANATGGVKAPKCACAQTPSAPKPPQSMAWTEALSAPKFAGGAPDAF